MVHRLAFAAVVLLALGAAIVAVMPAQAPRAVAADGEIQCIEDPLGPAPEWTLAIHGDLVQANTDSEGRIAVGGDATLTNFGVADRLPVDGSRVDLIVGGDLKATNVGVNHGSLVYGDELVGSVSVPNGTITKRPLDLDALFQEGQRRADAWQALEPNGTISGPEFGALSLTGSDAKLNVFRIDAERLEGAQRILLRVPFGSSVLVNVLGDSYSTATDPMTVSLEFWNGSSYVQFGDSAPSPELEALRRSLLWNFAEASSVQIGPQLAWHGSILAPGAAFSFPANTQLNGTIIAGSLAGDGESHLHPPDQICLPDPGVEPPDPPEPPPDPPPGPEPPPDPPPGPEPPPGPGPEPPPDPGTPEPDPPPDPPEPGPPPPEPTEPSPPPEPPPFNTPSQEAPHLPGAAERTNFAVVKQVLNRRGRPVELLEARPGQLVRFRLYGYNLGFVSARKVVACDRVPRGLEPVRTPGDPSFRRGRLCWRLGTVDTQRQGIVTFRVRRSVCGRLINSLRVRSSNGGRHGDTAQVSACRRAAPRQTG